MSPPEKLSAPEGSGAVREFVASEVAAAAGSRVESSRSEDSPGRSRGETMVLLDRASFEEREGRYTEALELYEQGLARLKIDIGERHPLVARTLCGVGICLKNKGDLEKSLAYLEQAVDIYNDQLAESRASSPAAGSADAPDPEDARAHLSWIQDRLSAGRVRRGHAHAYSTLGEVQYYRGQWPAAREAYEQALELRQLLFGEDHPLTVKMERNLSLLAGSESFEAGSIEDRRRARQHDAHGLLRQGNRKFAAGEREVALTLYERALETLGPGSRYSMTAYTLCAIAHVKFSLGEHRDTLRLYSDAIDIYGETIGERHVVFASALTHRADAYRALQEYDSALEDYTKALRLKVHKLGRLHPDVAQTMYCMAECREGMKDLLGALALFEHALAIRRATFGEWHAIVAQTSIDCANIKLDLGRPEEALAAYETALELLKETAPHAGRPDVAGAHAGVGRACLELGRAAEAVAAFQAALDARAEAGGDEAELRSLLAKAAALAQEAGKEDG